MAASSWRRLLASKLVVLFTGFRPLSYTVNLVPMRLDLQNKTDGGVCATTDNKMLCPRVKRFLLAAP